MHAQGLGGPKDEVEARRLLGLAALQLLPRWVPRRRRCLCRLNVAALRLQPLNTTFSGRGHGPWTMRRELWTMDHALSTMDLCHGRRRYRRAAMVPCCVGYLSLG